MSDQMKYIETNAGKLALKQARFTMSRSQVPEDSNERPSIADFVAAVSDITVPTIVGNAGQVLSPEMAEARKNFDAIFNGFINDHVEMDDMDDEEAAPSSKKASARIHVSGMDGSARLNFGGGRASEPSSGGTAEDTAEEDAPAPKRKRLGMSDADLSRACTVMDMPAARVTPQFLVDKPLDVRMYTPLLIDLYASVRKMTEGLALLAKEIVVFEGDFLELSAAAVAALPTTKLFASCDIESGSRLLHRLESAHALASTLRGKNLRCQRAFWLANHTPGCNWDTWEQLCHREDQDAGADLCNPSFTPLTTWEEQVKAAIVAARQETAALSKDGKTLLGPVLPRLQARHHNGKNTEWRPKGPHSYKGGDKPPGSRAFTSARRNHRGGGKPHGASGKENRGKNAATPPAAKPSPAAAKPAGDP